MIAVGEGSVFGYWTVKKMIKKPGDSRQYVECVCKCGTTRIIRARALVKSESLSCGCRKSELLFAKNHRHGKSKSRIYTIYLLMLRRCHDASSDDYARYGGRGIFVCERWRNSFADFYSDMGDPPERMSLDRKDNNGGYSPDNCRWATAVEQGNNTRRNRLVEYRGKRQTVAAWARELNMRYAVILNRLNKGWAVDDVFNTPVGGSRNRD